MNLPIILDDVICYGNENSIYDCSHGVWTTHHCVQDEDIGVRCEGRLGSAKPNICVNSTFCINGCQITCPQDLNSSCTTSIGSSDEYAECKYPPSGTNATYQCKNNYSAVGGICKAVFNSSCNNVSGCSDQYAECKATTPGANNTCQCKSNYTVVEGICKAVLPAVVVAVSLGVTKLEGYGNEKFCWLSIQYGLIWAFVGPAASVTLLNFIIIILVFHRMFSSSAMLTKSDKVKAKSAARSLCVLLPITGITWVFGILSVNEDLVVFQYLFAIINSLQGLFISLFYCFFNRHLREAMKQINAARRRSKASYSATLKSSSRSTGQIKFDSLDDSRKNNASDIVASSKNPFLQADRQMQKMVEKQYATDGQPINEFAEYSKNIPNNRSGGDVSIEDVKISNILHESEIRKDLDHTEVAATSLLISTASSSTDKDTGESKIPRESHKYDYIDVSRLDENQGEYQTALEPILSSNLRTSADGERYQIFGKKPSQSHDNLVPKSGFDPNDSRYDKSRRYDQDLTSSKERLSIARDKGIISSWEKQSTSHEKLENVNLKRTSKDEFYDTGQSSGAKVQISNSKSKPSKDSKGKRPSSKSRKADEEYKSKEAKRDSKYAKRKSAESEQNRGRPSTRTSKAKDIASAKKRSRDRSQDYESSAYDLAYMGPQVYHSSVKNVAEYMAYNPYVGVHAYGGQHISPVDPWQYYQPHSQQPRKKYW